MPPCPMCLGDGQHDFRDSDANVGEQFSDAQINYLRVTAGLQHPLGVIPCSECEGTGVVSATRLADVMAECEQVISALLEMIENGPAGRAK